MKNYCIKNQVSPKGLLKRILVLSFAGLVFFPRTAAAQQSVYFNNFIRHADNSVCNHIPPQTGFTAYLNNDESNILIENAPRWDVGGDPNISGNGTFGVELGNFINPSLQIGDKAHIRFTCYSTGQQGIVSDSVTGIPWPRFPLILNLVSENIPQPPQNLILAMDSTTGHRTLTWTTSAGMKYTVYRRIFSEILPGGDKRMLYHRLAENLTTGSYTDQSAVLNESYGYIVYAVSSEGIISEHSEEVNEDAPPGSDLTIGFIARLPRINYVWGSSNPAVEGWPAAGQQVTWQAHIKNWSAQIYPAVKYKWYLDSIAIDSGTVVMPPDSIVTVNYPWSWTFDRHELKFVIDPYNSIPEEEEGNNELMIYTNAISAGFYVEQSTYNYFHQYQKFLKVHSNCWEDWAQRHVKRWNQMFKNGIFPEAPNGVYDRIRIDAIHIVPDSALPLAGGLPSNNPNMNDRTVDLQWGFTAEILNGTFYANHTSVSDNNAFYFEGSLMHELGHARYLIDVYGFDINDNGTGNSIAIKENGQLIVGSPYLLAGVYHTPIHGLMNGQYTYVDRYSAPAMNLIKGHRAVMGNYNAPNNIGVFMQNLPTANYLLIKDQNGNILSNASVKIYRSEPLAGVWYGKYYDNTPDMDELTTDGSGKVAVGRCPFDDDGTIDHTYGYSNSVAIVRASHNGLIGYGFLEVSSFNLAFWRGETDTATHEVKVNLVDLTSAEESGSVPADFVLKQNYPNPFNPSTTIQYSVPERNFITIRVYDILGNMAALLVNEEKEAGNYSVKFDASKFPSGIYFYSLQYSSGKTPVRKMLLIK